MLAKEIEAAGLPVAYVTTLDALAQSVGANRIIRGKAIINVTGDPSLQPPEERKFRKGVVAKALQALTVPVEESTILD